MAMATVMAMVMVVAMGMVVAEIGTETYWAGPATKSKTVRIW